MKGKPWSHLQHTLYSMALIALATIALVGSNFLAGFIPDRIMRIDTSVSGLYTLSEQTEQSLGELGQDITIYHICTAGKEDPVIPTILQQYSDRSKHVKVLWRDPAAYPNFVSQYTDQALPDNSLIVTGKSGKSCVIPFTKLYVADFEEYYASGNVVYEYAVESQLTSAIRQFTSDQVIRLYLTEGHGEQDISASMKQACEQQGMDFHEVSLLRLAVPADCDCLVIFNPQLDFTREEVQTVEDYLTDGGSVMLVSDYILDGRPNLEQLMERLYGISACDGVVMESDSAYSMASYPYYLLPEIVKHGITKPLISGKYTPVVPIAQGLQVAEDLPNGTIAEVLLRSSDSAYLKDPYKMTSYDQKAEDPTGQYALAVAASNDLTGSKTVWFSSAVLWSDEAIRQSSGANQDLILNSFGWLCEHAEMVTIHAKSTYLPGLTVPRETVVRLSCIMIGLIPFVLLLTGGYAAISRRRRK